MMNYLNIINDSKINNIYSKIQKQSNYYMDHSKKHRDNVINYCKTLIDIFQIEPKVAKKILIAASLHDIGRLNPNNNHAESGATFARAYLENKLPIEDVNFICNLIKMHNGFKDRTFYQEILYFADKLDFTKNRLEDNYKEKYGFTSVLESIKKIHLEINNQTLIVKIITDNTISIKDLIKEKRKYDIGMEYNVSSIASMKNLKYEIYWDNNIIFKGNKKIELI